MSEKYFAGGFLFHPPTHSVLLQLRGSKTPHNPNTWCFLGGWSEDVDVGDPAATWRREMREELGITISLEDTIALADYRPPSSPFYRYIFYCPWSAIDRAGGPARRAPSSQAPNVILALSSLTAVMVLRWPTAG